MNNDAYLVKDLIQGDDSVASREDFLILSPTEIKKAIDIIVNNKYFSETTKKELLLNSWRVTYKSRPPTPEEFLTPEWIGDMSDETFPYWKDLISDLFNPHKNYKNIILYSCIGSGKSTFTALCNLYVSVMVYLMRNPKKTLGVGPSSTICNVFLAFSRDKAYETMIKPFIEIMGVSEKFEQCRTIEQMKTREKELTNKICWTTAGISNVLTFGSNMNIKLRSSSSGLLGLTILMGSATELAFFKEAGWSDAEIMKLYNDLKGRIFSRFPDAFFAKSILDSSPNDASFEASIDYWILNKALKPDHNGIITNYLFRGKKWELQPQNFPEWNADNSKVFWIFLGGKEGKMPKILYSKDEIIGYNTEDILECPIDGLPIAEEDLIKFIKDFAAIPAGASNRLIYDNTKIEKVFTPILQNIYSHITAPDTEPPEGLIWNKIKDIFFIEIDKKNHVYEFYRNPNEKRYVSVDLSETGDTASVAVSHPELNLDGEIIDVVDMTVPIIPNKGRIGLDSIKFFILDLKRYGRLNIDWVSFDGFQSSSSQEFIKREGFNIEELSVDFPAAPYLNFIQSVKTNRVKSGKNIYLKNNLKSLKMSSTKGGKPKVDHEMGKVENSLDANDNWETSSLGFNAKDVSDSVCATVELRKKHFEGVPRYIYQDVYIEDNSKEPVLTNLKKHTMKLKKTN